jgi:hypothetical protein
LGGFLIAKKWALANADSGQTLFESVPLLYVFGLFWAFWAFGVGKRLGGGWAFSGSIASYMSKLKTHIVCSL